MPEILFSDEVKPKEMVDLQIESLDKDAEFFTLNLLNLEPEIRISMKSITEIVEAGLQIQ